MPNIPVVGRLIQPAAASEQQYIGDVRLLLEENSVVLVLCSQLGGIQGSGLVHIGLARDHLRGHIQQVIVIARLLRHPGRSGER